MGGGAMEWLKAFIGLIGRILLILIFLIPATLIFHTNLADRIQMIMFMKNVSMFGGCLLLLSAGPGRLSLDFLIRKKKG